MSWAERDETIRAAIHHAWERARRDGTVTTVFVSDKAQRVYVRGPEDEAVMGVLPLPPDAEPVAWFNDEGAR